MKKIAYKMIAKAPLFTGSDSSLGIKSELRKQRVKMINPRKIKSKFKTEQDRENAVVNLLLLLYNHISPDYRMSRGKEIWQEYKSRLLSAAGGKNKKAFLTRYAKSYGIGVYSTEILPIMNAFDDHELIYYLRDYIDHLILRVRFNREEKNANRKEIKELEKRADLLKDKIEIAFTKPSLLDSDSDKTIKDELEKINEKIRELERDETSFETIDVLNEESELEYVKAYNDVPYFTGNSIGGILRRLTMEDFFARVGISATYDFAYHTLFTGGVLKLDVRDSVIERVADILSVSVEKAKISATEKMKKYSGSQGEVDLDKIDKMTFVCPPLRLFGAAIGNMMIESEMIIANAELICEENNNGDTSLWGLMEDVFYTRSDSSKSERDIEIIETSDDAHQMKYIMETIIKGAQFEHNFICKTDNYLVYSVFNAALKLFVEYPYIGGKSSRGLGLLDLSELNEQIDADAVKFYYEHLDENKDEIRNYFDVGIKDGNK